MSSEALEKGNVRERPLLNSNFLVDLGQRDPRHSSQGFAEVEFPPFRIHPTEDAPEPSGQDQRLILRRGVCGALDLYDWWHKARRGKAPSRRLLKIHLLAEDQETIVLTWRFHRVRPVCLSYSPLRAQEGTVFMETLELSFESVEMS